MAEEEIKHTPGPWAKEGNWIYSLMSYGYQKGKEVFKNRFWFSVSFDKEVPEDERAATMNLLHAAPELLEALKDAVFIIKDMGAGGSMLTRFEAAIAKAEGRES